MFFIFCTSDILSAWSVSVVQQKVVSGNGCFIDASQLQRLIFSGSGYQLQSWRSAARCNHPKLLMICLSAASSVDAAEKPIRINSGLQQIRLSAADLFFSRRTSIRCR
ncbi:hypothetical protein L1987_71002 [Smallanthus sonchifolius]|uniref:Uncharacterized protein n=1 Tax=Smallanthus sonchifolius TaxID=185202 RepID=A0ACB9AR87_9ASTR|nr:hypothetical protein L1987_71002 [Smallanthus sonchifolius]